MKAGTFAFAESNRALPAMDMYMSGFKEQLQPMHLLPVHAASLHTHAASQEITVHLLLL